MICQSCSLGATLVAAKRNYPIQDVPLYDYDTSITTYQAIRSLARFFHGLCKNCDCQHFIDWEGTMIRRG